MTFRKDPDLAFLKECSDEDLKNLADILIYDAKGSKRIASSLLSNPLFQKAQKTGRYVDAWEAIATEYQLFGGDSLVNFIRGKKGVTYREILSDLCKLLKIDTKKREKTVEIERRFMMELLRQSLQGMSPEDRKKFIQSNNMIPGNADFSDLSVPAMTTALTVLLRTGGGVVARRLLLSLVNIVMKTLLGRSLSLAASETLLRSLIVFSGPVGWTLNVALFLPFLTGPNKKVTLVATLYIAALRRSLSLEKKHEKRPVSGSFVPHEALPVKRAPHSARPAPAAARTPSRKDTVVPKAAAKSIPVQQETAFDRSNRERINEQKRLLQEKAEIYHLSSLEQNPVQDKREWELDDAWDSVEPVQPRPEPAPATPATPEACAALLRKNLAVPKVPPQKNNHS